MQSPRPWALAQYAILALPLAFSGLPLFIYAPDFYTGAFGVSLSVMGIILLCVRAFDALQDPLIGTLSDRYASKRLSLLFVAMLLLGAGFLMLYHPVQSAPALWFTLSMIIATLAFSILSINLNAIGSLWSSDTATKATITTTREAMGLVGLMTATILPSVLQQQGFATTEVYSIYAIVFLVLLALAGGVFLRWGRTQAFVTATPRTLPPTWNFKSFLNPQFRPFFAVYGFSMLASSIPAVLVLFFIRERLGAEHLTGIFLLLYFSAGIIGMPLWKICATRLGLEKSWIAGMVLSIVTFSGALFLVTGDIWAYGAVCVLSGIALSAELALPPALLSRLIDEQKTESETSALFSWMIFLTKAVLAIGTGVSFLVLGLAGFVPHSTGNSPSALLTLSILYAFVPCCLKAIAALILWRSVPRVTPAP